MRLARTIGLIAAVTAATLTAIASTAYATEPLSFTNAAGTSCSALPGQRCAVHITNEPGEQIEVGAQIPLLGYVHQANCDFEANYVVNGVGVGGLAGLNISNCSSTVTPCNTDPWPSDAEETAPGVTQVEMQMCISTPVGNCSGDYIVNMALDSGTPEPADLEWRSANRAPVGNSICRVTGHWTKEGTDLRVIH